MPIKVGSSGPTVTLWQKVMVRRFASYSKAADGGPLRADGYYGNDDAAVQREYERRTHQPIDGIVSDGDLVALGISPVEDARGMPWLFTVHGTGMADPLGPGIPADTARGVLDKYRWQPIGNYPAVPFPMKPSIDKGRAELVLQLEQKPGPLALAGYSQGAVVVGQVLKHDIMAPEGRLHHRLKDVRKVVFWGNPMRQQGIAHFDHWKYPVAPADSFGIMADRLEGLDNATFEVRDYAHSGDMYACVKDREADEWKVMVQRLIFSVTDFFGGEDSLVAQLLEWGQKPLSETIAAATAGIEAIRFFMNLDQHNYNRFPAVDFLRS